MEKASPDLPKNRDKLSTRGEKECFEGEELGLIMKGMNTIEAISFRLSASAFD
jgi:hypothetical protein